MPEACGSGHPASVGWLTPTAIAGTVLSLLFFVFFILLLFKGYAGL